MSVIAHYLGQIPPKHGARVQLHKTGETYYVYGEKTRQ